MANIQSGILFDLVESTFTDKDTMQTVPVYKALLETDEGQLVTCKVGSKAAFDRLESEIGSRFRYVSTPYDVYRGITLYSHRITFKVKEEV